MIEHVGENEVVDLLEGRLDAAAIERITIHLDACSSCRELVAESARDAKPKTERGTSVGRYLVLDRVGVGSMGIVYSAWDPELNRRIALKLLRADAFAATQDASTLRSRLLREAQALARLSHPNVMTIFDVGTHEGEVFLAMEFVEGGTVGEWLHAGERSTEAILAVFRQAGEGLAAAHDVGIVHRDFKPDNVLRGNDDRVRVSDFGLARASGAPAPSASNNPTDASLTTTRTGALVGTPAYMAPEQWAGRPSDARTDVFSFCVALYEALYRERPFAGATIEELSQAIEKNEVRASSRSIPRAVRRAVLKGLRANPDERPASMRALLDELAPKRRVPMWAVMMGLIALTTISAFAFRSHPQVCKGAPSEWGDAFDTSHEEQLRAALSKSGSGAAQFAFTTVKTTLDAYRASWIAARTEACEATRVRGEQSETLLDLRMRCLDERRVAVRAFVHSVETGTGETLPERAVTAVTTLARIDDCADARALSTPMPLPAEPAKRERIKAISKRVAEVEAEAIEANDALAMLEPLLADAKEVGWAPLLARVEYDHALRQSRLRNNRQAEIELQEAAVTAEAARVDAVMTDAWIRLVFVVGYQEHRVEEGLLWGRYAQAAIARLGGDEFRQTVLYGYIGVTLLNDETRFEEALTNFERGLEISKRVGPKSAIAHGMGATALALFMMGRPAEAASYERRNRAILEEMFGPESIDIAVSLGNEGEELLETGNIDEAMPLLERSRVMQERFGRNDAALLNVIGLALRKKGKLEEALAIDQRALEMTKKNESPDAYTLSSAEIPVAIDLLALGRAREALPLAEHAVNVRMVTSQSERGEAKFVLAKASFETGDTARALRLAAEAATDYEPTATRYGGRYRAAKDEIEVWQAAHRK